MTTGPIRRQIVLFTIPIMLKILLQQLYNMVDTIIVGNFVGENALASVGTSTPVTALFIAVATGMSTGCSIIISQMFGAKQTENIKRAVSTALILNGALGLVFTAVAHAAAGFIFSVMLNLDAALLADAVTYFHIYCLGLLFQFLYNAAAAILRSVGDSKASLYFLLASSVTNIILDLVFILCFRMGVAGAALATVLSQALACVLSLVYMHRKYEFLRLSLSELRFDREMGALALKLGIPVALQQCVVSLGQLAVQRLVNTFGMTSGYTAAIRLENIVLIPVFGLNAGMATFAGQNIGARREDRVSKGLWNTLVIGLARCAVLGMVCVLFAPELVSLFGVSGFGLTVGERLYPLLCALLSDLLRLYDHQCRPSGDRRRELYHVQLPVRSGYPLYFCVHTGLLHTAVLHGTVDQRTHQLGLFAGAVHRPVQGAEMAGQGGHSIKKRLGVPSLF